MKNKCIRCETRDVFCKEMCSRCYYATKRGYKTHKEQLIERNYIKDGVGKITDRKGNEWTLDLEDFEKCKSEFWTDNNNGYAKSNRVGYLHKLICPQWKIVDHIDRNPYNCKKENLRDGGNGINGMNRITNPRSGHKGVYPSKGKWQARPKKNLCLGTFNTIEEAWKVVKQWATENNLTEFYTIK